VSSRTIRLLVLPALLLVSVSGLAFALAELHPAKPSLSVSGPVRVGDQYRGQTVFTRSCTSCHGEAGKGGGIGPKLAGSGISLATAKAQIDNGGGGMPAGIVSGGPEKDVLAYLATILPR
jgi:mono/diheme cytochrome c family protein